MQRWSSVEIWTYRAVYSPTGRVLQTGQEFPGRLKYWAAGDAAQQRAEAYRAQHGGVLAWGAVSMPTGDDTCNYYPAAVAVVPAATARKIAAILESVDPGAPQERITITRRNGRAWWDITVFAIDEIEDPARA